MPIERDLALQLSVSGRSWKQACREGDFLGVLVCCALSMLCMAASIAQGANVDLQARRERLLAMAPEQKERLFHNQERLAALPATEQQKLRKVADELESDPQAEHLHHILVRYHDWLKKLSPGQRAELLELPADQRLAKIKEIRADQSRRIHQESAAGEPVTLADFNHIIKWIEGYAWKHRDALLQDATPEMRKQIERLPENKRHRSILWLLLQRWRGGQQGGLPPISEQDIAALTEKLSPQAHDRLTNSAGLSAQRQLVHRWVQAAVRHRMETVGASRSLSPIAQHELEQFFEHELTSDQREQLLALPPEKMQRELRRLYFLQPGHVAGVQTLSGEPDAVKPSQAGGKHHKANGKEKSNGKSRGQHPADGKGESADGKENAEQPATDTTK